METISYQVTGMTCGHCISSVHTQVSGVTNVIDVQVDLASGQLLVTSTQPIDPADIQAAVEEAGYQLSSRAWGQA